MDCIRTNRSRLVGCTKSKTAVLEALIRINSLNLTGALNYNAGGVKDGIGFENVTEKFVDNFLLRVLVPDYNTKNGKNIFIGAQNKTIRKLLDAHGLEKCKVKAVGFTKLNGSPPPNDMLARMPQRNIEKEARFYFYQDYKVACPNLPYHTVLDFIINADYIGIGFFLKDIDVTIDYAGSFDKYEVINYLTSEAGFREEGVEKDALRTIVNNDTLVGRNCLTIMETIDGLKTRQKIYNKMVQMLECKSVRNVIGCHWKDWVCQKDTRLADARDKAKDRGLTRAEVTFYIDSTVPSDHFIDSVLQSVIKYVPKSIVYSTPYAAIWKEYCAIFKHSLVCVDRREDIGVVVYSCNQITGNVSGQLVERWSEREKWCLDKLTLNGNLPLDVIEIVEVSKIFNGKKNDILLEISGNRYYKIDKDSSTRFPTRLVSNRGVYSYNSGTSVNNEELLKKAGFLEHENCIPYLAKSQGGNNNRAVAELQKIGGLEVNVMCKDKKDIDGEIKRKLFEQAKDIEEIRKPLLMEFKRVEEEIKRIKEYKELFKSCNTLPLRDLKQGSYTVCVAKKQKTRFGTSYKLLVDVDGDNYIIWSNHYINTKIEQILGEQRVNITGDFISSDSTSLGVLTITGRGVNQYNHITVYCKFTLNTIARVEGDNAPSIPVLDPIIEKIPVISRENLLPYREYENITILPVLKVYTIDAIGNILHYGTSRLVIKIDGKIYQAGEDLEEKVDQLTYGCSIKIEKIRVNRTKHVKFAVCTIYEKGDWTSVVDYKKTPMLTIFDGSTCVVDVRCMEISGKKRKLLLTSDGDVYKLKKSKLEETIKPGFV